MKTCRIVSNFFASTLQLTVIIMTIGLYVKAVSPNLNEDKKFDTSKVPFGVWHMVNIYQYWIFLEFISYFTSFFVIMVTLLIASLCHLKIERVLKVPAGLV